MNRQQSTAQEENLFDYQMARAASAYRLADMLEEQASRPHVGDELTSRVETLRRRADEQRRFGDERAREAFRYAMYFQFAA